jgi:hypothetical protein
MTPVTQTILHDPDSGTVGNCMQAAIATLLDLPLDDVPHFAEHDDWDIRLGVWCHDRGLLWCKFGVQTLPEWVPCLLTGKSPRGIAHVVVGRGLSTVWDPHPSRDGLTSIGSVWVLARPEGGPGPTITPDTWDELTALPEDWDSYGALPPASTAIDVARRLVESVSAVPMSDGGVQVEWRGAGIDVEISVKPDGSASVLFCAEVRP